MYYVHSFVDTASSAIFVLHTICSMVQWELSYISTRSSIWVPVSQRARTTMIDQAHYALRKHFADDMDEL